MMRLIIFGFLVINILGLQAQELKKLNTKDLAFEVTRISVDRLGGFYLAGDCGFQKYSTEGEPLEEYHPRGCTEIELLEAWNPLRIFAYQRYHQAIRIFDHSVIEVEQIKIDAAFAIKPWLAAPANDNNHYWILDEDHTLKKIDLRSNSVATESEPIGGTDATIEFVHLREYQNMLFLLDRNSGIFILNKLGKVVDKIETKGANYFSVLGEDIYYLEGNRIHFYNIFTKETYYVEVSSNPRFVIATDERLILVRDKVLEVFEFKPRR